VHREAETPDSTGLDIAIDRDAEIPIGVQLAWALRTRIGDGRLAAGQRLPGLREVAAATAVNVNTVRAVYQRLEQEGLIDSHQGSGTFVAATPRRADDVATIAAEAARDAAASGVDPRDVAAALYVSSRRERGDAGAAGGRRRALRQQIAALERALGEMEAKHPGVAPPVEPGGEDAVPLLLGVDELERVRELLVRRLAIVQAAIDRLGQPATAERDPPAKPGKRTRAAQSRARLRPAAEGA
jgi:DNA-binding transcriptional regulator YhcF (GntR family)